MSQTFGAMLRHLRRRCGLTQQELAGRLGYSRSLIAALERDERLPDVDVVASRYVPALELETSHALSHLLVKLAADARHETAPVNVVEGHRRRWERETDTTPDFARIPIPPTNILGREPLIRQICDSFLEAGTRLLTLVGPPGVGKTRLAQAVATRMEPFFADGACFVSFVSVTDPDLVLSQLLAALGVRGAALRPEPARLIAAIRRRELLLLLDNFEQVVSAAPLLTQLLAECAGLRLLVTSREPLRLRAERRLPVPPLEIEWAVELFAQRASAIDDTFALTPSRQPAVEAICRRLDQLPLAIELAAAQSEDWGLDELLAHIQRQRLNMPLAGARDLPAHQRSLRMAFHSSYSMLCEAEQTLFRSLSVFAGEFALTEAAELQRPLPNRLPIPEPAVASAAHANARGQLETLMQALVTKNLVVAMTTPRGALSYRLLESVREFATEQALAHGEMTRLQARHFGTMTALFLEGDGHLRTRDVDLWMARLYPYLNDLRAAVQWATDAGRYEDAARCVVVTSFFWNLCDLAHEEARLLAQLLAHRHVFAFHLRAAFLLTYCRTTAAFEEHQPTQPYLDEAGSLLNEQPHQLLRAIHLSFCTWYAADAKEAAAILERAIGLTQTSTGPQDPMAGYGAITDRTFNLAVQRWAYASLLADLGRTEAAELQVNNALDLFTSDGNQVGICDCYGLLGYLALLRGDVETAHQKLTEAVAVVGTLRFGATQRDWSALLGLATLYRGDADGARRLLEKNLRRQAELKNTIVLAQVCSALTEVALCEGDAEEAYRLLAESLANTPQSNRGAATHVDRVLLAARVAAALDDNVRAASLFGIGHTLVGDSGKRHGPSYELAMQAMERLRSQMGRELFEHHFTAGKRASPEQADVALLGQKALAVPSLESSTYI